MVFLCAAYVQLQAILKLARRDDNENSFANMTKSWSDAKSENGNETKRKKNLKKKSESMGNPAHLILD